MERSIETVLHYVCIATMLHDVPDGPFGVRVDENLAYVINATVSQ